MPRAREQGEMRPIGLAPIDRVLGGGLAAGKLHEVFPAGAQDEASTMGFAVMLIIRLTQGPGPPILWLREEAAQCRAGLHGPGLVDLGLDPGRLILGVLPDARALLRAGADALRCAALGVVVLELGGNPPLLDLTASRRLALAAEGSGVTPLLLRLGGARLEPSAAQTRWQVAALPSAPLAADAPGHPALTLSLLRQRGGPAGLDWNVEWNRDAACFRSAALPGARLPLPGGGSLPADGAADDAGEAGWRIAS
jgi:protein ImuA